MTSTSCIGNSRVRIEVRPGLLAGLRKVAWLVPATLAAAALAACAESPAATNKSEFLAAGRQASLKVSGNSFGTNRRAAVMVRKHAPLATKKQAARAKIASYGLASFYAYQAKTASGEKFNANAFTAAHPTLPFGTRLRVTNVATGQSVIVRVNDRGPFVPGRVVDVSYSAAKTLGIIGRGTAKVKLDVVQ
jgi:peptidoglycan lytic transglycosylase